jgi:hypothetical protein
MLCEGIGQFWSVKSNLIVSTTVTVIEKVYGASNVFHVSLQLLPEKCFTPIIIQRVTLEMRTEPRVRLHVKYPLLLSYFRQNCDVSTNFNNPPKNQIS